MGARAESMAIPCKKAHILVTRKAKTLQGYHTAARQTQGGAFAKSAGWHMAISTEGGSTRYQVQTTGFHFLNSKPLELLLFQKSCSEASCVPQGSQPSGIWQLWSAVKKQPSNIIGFEMESGLDELLTPFTHAVHKEGLWLGEGGSAHAACRRS